MAVNGVEIKVGQVWKTRGGYTSEIIGHDATATLYPWETDLNWLTSEGCDSLSTRNDLDLVALLHDVPLPPLDSPSASLPDATSLFDTKPIDMTAVGYASLANVLQMAYNQAAVGKGVERHAVVGEPFHEQVMQIGAAKFGVGSLIFQAFKKSEESQRLEHGRAVNELLGAIVYLAGAVIALEKKRGGK